MVQTRAQVTPKACDETAPSQGNAAVKAIIRQSDATEEEAIIAAVVPPTQSQTQSLLRVKRKAVTDNGKSTLVCHRLRQANNKKGKPSKRH